MTKTCPRCKASIRDAAYVCPKCQWFSLDETSRRDLTEILTGAGVQRDETENAVNDIEITIWLCVKDSDVRLSNRAERLPLVGTPEKPGELLRAVREALRLLPAKTPILDEVLVSHVRADLQLLEANLTFEAENIAFNQHRGRPARRGRSRDPIRWQLAWDLATTLLAVGVPITKARDGIYACVLTHAFQAAGDPIEETFRYLTKIVDVARHHSPKALVACRTTPKHNNTPSEPDADGRSSSPWARLHARATGPCWVPCWALGPDDVRRELNDPPILLVARR